MTRANRSTEPRTVPGSGGIARGLRSLLLDPDGFFRRWDSDPTLRRPALVVLLLGASNLFGIAALLHVSVQGAPEGARGYVAAGYLFTMGSTLVGGFAVWLVYAALIHLVSGVLGGEGAFGQTLSAVGWGFVPAVLSALLYSAGVAHAALSLPPPDPASLDAFGRTVRETDLVRLMSRLGVLFTLWQGFLWTFGVKHARGLTLRRAGLAASLPVGLSILRQGLVML